MHLRSRDTIAQWEILQILHCSVLSVGRIFRRQSSWTPSLIAPALTATHGTYSTEGYPYPVVVDLQSPQWDILQISHYSELSVCGISSRQ
jgi:hypothetical protein